MQSRALTADDFITEVQFLQSRASHYWRKAVEKLEKLERFASYCPYHLLSTVCVCVCHFSLWSIGRYYTHNFLFTPLVLLTHTCGSPR